MERFPDGLKSDISTDAGNGPDAFAELAALARLLTYARRTAGELDAAFVEYCIGMALDSINEKLRSAGNNGSWH